VTLASLKVHRILLLAVVTGLFPRERLVGEIRRLGISRNPYGAVASLMTNAGNAFGLVASSPSTIWTTKTG
jgi:hypothetical protein